MGPSFRIAGRADCNRARLTYVVRHGGPTAFTELPTLGGPALPSFITFNSKSRRNGLYFDHCGSLAIEARLAEVRAGGTVSVAA